MTTIPQAVVEQLASTVPADAAGTGRPSFVGEGLDAAVYRWGERALRLPIRPESVQLLEHEYRWVSEATQLLVRSGIDVPTPRFRGVSSDIFEYPWLVVDYIDGTPLADVPLDQRDRIARDLAVGFAALHQAAPDAAPISPFRGVPLSDKAARFEARIEGLPVEDGLRRAFTGALDAEAWQAEPVWCHGDPHPANLLTREGKLVGIVDFSDIGQGDPAVDYAAFFLGFTEQQRQDARVVLRALGAADDDALWLRARGWAAVIAASLLTADREDLRARGEQCASLLMQG